MIDIFLIVLIRGINHGSNGQRLDYKIDPAQAGFYFEKPNFYKDINT